MSGVVGDAGRRPRRRERGLKSAAGQSTSQLQLSRRRRDRALTRADVSRPCQPRWITRVDAADSNFRSAFADYLPAPSVPPAADDAVTSDNEFRPRLPTN